MKPEFDAVLLAGGKSSRMGNDKAFLEIAGVPLWQRQLRLLESLGPKQFLLAGPRRTEWSSSRVEIIADAQPDIGPLGGLLAALRLCNAPLLLALAVDLPRMTAGCLRGLLDLCDAECGVVPVTDQLEPLTAVYPTAALALAEEQLARGSYSLQELVNVCVDRGLMRTQSIHQTQADLFLNLNTPADLLTARESR